MKQHFYGDKKNFAYSAKKYTTATTTKESVLVQVG